MDDFGRISGPGKTAPRLITDLLDYDLRYHPRNGRNLLADPAPLFKGIGLARRGPLDCHHTLMRKDSQTNCPASNAEKFDGSEEWTVAAYCLTCRYHFTITADYMHSKNACQLSDVSNPLHHLVLTQSENAEQYAARCSEEDRRDKFDQTAEFHRFMCSAKQCSLQVEIKISPPRLNPDILSSILDVPKVLARGRREIEDKPERYAGLSPVRPIQALGYLRTYIKDAKASSETSPENLRQIARRNKKYMLAFGDECDALFEYLDFTSIQDNSPESNGEPAYFWRPPLIQGLNKNFFEDVLIEIEIKMHERPPLEQQAGNTIISLRPLPALKDIERSLGYYDYPKRSRTVDLSAEEHPYYASLGAVDNFTDDFLSWAYDRQCECDPSRKPYYLDCLEDLAKGRGSSDLQMKVVMATSAGEYGLKAIEGAYRFFGLDPSTKEGDEHIMGLYKSRIESAPRQKEEAKACLLIVAKARNSTKIEALANDKTMTFEEALEFLSVTADTASDSIEAAAIAMALDTDKAKVARALRVIANQRSDYALQKAASSMESGTSDFMLDIGEAYNRLQITARNASDDMVFNYYTSLSNGAAAGSKDSFTQALRTIAHDRQSAFLLRKLDDPNADVQAEPGTADQPVGLDNIGNTCYLNSLLQYFYTIKPVRDVVMNIEEYRMALTEDDLKKKRAGGRLVTKAEVIKGQRFMEEMHNLFENLKTAPTRSIKPTKELAELSFFNESLEETIRRASVASPHGPPSIASIMNGPVFGPDGPPPPIPSRPPATIEEDIEMVDRPGEKNLENGSDSSEATLVDMDPLPAYNETNSKEIIDKHSTTENTDQETDAIMVNGENLDGLGIPLPAPEKPPPVPPRNKSGLIIQTTESQDLIPDDVRWKLGTQQDVDEVIRNTTFRMMCAIKPTTTDPKTGEQTDKVRDTFYGDNATYLDKTTKLERKVESWSSLLVYASKTKSIDIYEALDTVFDVQKVEVENTTAPQYASIDKLPPVLQIQINRTDYDIKLNVSYKIKNAVTFPETIYLDRYMDSEEPDSTLMRRRRQGWEWKAELRTLEARLAALQNTPRHTESETRFPALQNSNKFTGPDINVADALLSTKDYISCLQEEEIDGIEVDPTLPDLLDERISEVGIELENISGRIATLKQSLAEQFTDMRQYEYKLQAVFIHRGEAGGGHYWIYIYDFKSDIWREYNDEYVTVVKDRRRIFEHQDGFGGTPYYLVYVRSSDRDELVDPVCRDVQEMQMMDVGWNGQMDDEGIVMEDVDDTRHIEHAKPRPIRPKPTNTVDGWESSWDHGGDSSLDANGRKW